MNSPTLHPVPIERDKVRQEIDQFHPRNWRSDSTGISGKTTILLTSVGGTWNEDFAISGQIQPTPHLSSCPYLSQVMQALNLPISRSRLIRVAGGTEIDADANYNYHWFRHLYLYIPLVVSRATEVWCDGESLPVGVGEPQILDPFKSHRIVNPTDNDDIFLVVETKGSLREETGGQLTLEPYTFEVLTPSEIENLTQDILAEVKQNGIPESELSILTEKIEEFRSQWKVTFSRWGHHSTGELAYQDLLLGFKEEITVKVNKWLSASGEGKKATAIISSMLLLSNRPSSKKVNRRLLARKKKRVKPTFHWDASYFTLESHHDSPLLTYFRTSSTPLQVWQKIAAQGKMNQEEFGKTVQKLIQRQALREDIPSLEFDRPLFIVSAPRAGSTLLFETLIQFPDLWTIGMESHEIIEQFPALSPSAHGFESNRLTQEDASPDIISSLRNAFVGQLRNRDEQGYLNLPLSQRPSKIRFLEKTPKNALRIPFLKAVFPQARFIYLYREPKANISSMIEGWRSRCFVSYKQLPGWPFKGWNFLLTPGWSEYQNASVAEIAAYQWKTANEYILQDLQSLPNSSWCLVNYQDLVKKPKETITKISNFAGLHWDSHVEQRVSQSLPTSTVTLSAPSPDKWRKHAGELEQVLPTVEPIIKLLEENYDYCAS